MTTSARSSRKVARRLIAATTALSAFVTVIVSSPAAAHDVVSSRAAETDEGSSVGWDASLYIPGVTADGNSCVLAATLSAPDGVDAAHPAPTVILGHGYAQDRSSMTPMADLLQQHGYVTLTFDAPGFGQSTCGVGLADPAVDGMLMRSLVDVLGGKPGTAFTDPAAHTPAGAVDFVVRDDDLASATYDPRVAVLGASYGGGLAFAVASVDPRVDTIIPAATFNDLEYSLFPQAAGLTEGVRARSVGVAKTTWGLGLVAGGQVMSTLQGLGIDPGRAVRCHFARAETCGDMIAAALRGFPDEAFRAYLDQISPHASIPRITAPVLLIQGEFDTLFTFNEALASYRQLQAQGNTVRLVWGSLGHNGGSSLDYDGASPSTSQPIVARIIGWLGHWLKDDGSDLGEPFTFTKTWEAAPESGTAADPDALARITMHLGAAGTLADAPATPTAPNRKQTLLANVLALPTGVGHVDAASIDHENGVYADYSLPGTQAYWQGQVLGTPVDVVGVPRATLSVSTPSGAWRAQPGNIASQVTLYLKIYDVAPDGSRSVVGAVSTPVRVDDTRKRVDVELQGIVHRFAAGHRIGFAVAGGDLNFRGGITPALVTIDAGVDGQTLILPVAE
ncbi:alpha/beta fold hydrolase [Microbacterium sp. SORGH_AS_0862]|uniref:alpha/beta fold hydrolase n=1 Tax=Microbacterium sp. SORGH_AS_0862 TaxID=3041789 RepID=UPI00279466B1|nr:alpha/beta fold hydrolase [Microbacterium sp. SORGH_AS_0862]MDQ1203889.1 pimeloyl-ACP methyl ester carboxylesterase [Microbacterium sp. SORGH_AS_0862]